MASNTRIFTAAVAIGIIHIILCAIWAAFVVLNSNYSILIIGLTVNIILPYLLISALSEPQVISRSDAHIVFSWTTTIINILVLLGLLFIWLVFSNTSLSESSPFNDYRWCCVFYSSSACPNTIPCVPNVALTELRMNPELKFHLVFTVVFLLVSIGHIGLNKLMRVSGVVSAGSNSKLQGEYLAALFSTICIIVYIGWASVVLLNTNHIHGYPRFAIPPSPNTFESLRYNFSYWILTGMAANGLVIYLFVAAVTNPTVELLRVVYLVLTAAFAIAYFIVAIVLATMLLWGCNSTFSGGSICNDYEYCCEFFASAIPYCANVTPCPAMRTLTPNPEFLLHIAFAAIFAVLNALGVWVHYRMRIYGVF